MEKILTVHERKKMDDYQLEIDVLAAKRQAVLLEALSRQHLSDGEKPEVYSLDIVAEIFHRLAKSPLTRGYINGRLKKRLKRGSNSSYGQEG